MSSVCVSEEKLKQKVKEMAKDSTGVLLVDSFGLIIDSNGGLGQE